MTDKKDTSLFENIDSEHLKFLNNKKTQVSYLRGENIFKQGAFAPYVIYVIDGLIKVFLQTGRDKQINLSLALPGDFLAFSSVFGEQVYTYSAIALKISTVPKENSSNSKTPRGPFRMMLLALLISFM